MVIKAQNALPRFFEIADSLLLETQFTDAAIAYERCIFAAQNTDDPILITRALLKKAYACKASGNFSQALQTLYRINTADVSDSLRLSIGYEIALNAYLAGNYTDAEAELQKLAYYLTDTVKLNQTLFLKILILNELQKWPEAKTCFTQYLMLNGQSPQKADELYAFMQRPRLKNPEKAQRLSTFMPGIGQIYGGNIGAGLLSLGLQLSLLGFGAYEIWQGYYLTGFTSGLALFQAFYFGGIENAAAVTLRKNKEKVRRYNDGVKKFILLVERAK